MKAKDIDILKALGGNTVQKTGELNPFADVFEELKGEKEEPRDVPVSFKLKASNKKKLEIIAEKLNISQNEFINRIIEIIETHL